MKQPGALWELKPTVRVLCRTSKIAKSEVGEELFFCFLFSFSIAPKRNGTQNKS